MPDRSTLENKAVEAYLSYLATGSLPVADNDEAIEVLDERIANEDQLHRKVVLIAERHRLANPPPPDPAPLVEKFVYYVVGFSERNNITYAVWREMGVPAKVLKEAGIPATKLNGIKPAVRGTPRLGMSRRTWTDEQRADYLAFYDGHSTEEVAAHFGVSPASVKQRYYQFKSDARKAAGEPRRPQGRPRKSA